MISIFISYITESVPNCVLCVVIKKKVNFNHNKTFYPSTETTFLLLCFTSFCESFEDVRRGVAVDERIAYDSPDRDSKRARASNGDRRT